MCEVDRSKWADLVLPGYEAKPGDSGILHSIRKLERATTNLKPHIPDNVSINSFPSRSEDESWAYRCRCTFQMIRDENGIFHYAMRHQKQPILLGADKFPIATLRIQQAMMGLTQKVLNSDCNSFSAIKQNLESATFSSAWQDTLDADCIVTLNYGKPLVKIDWEEQARVACDILNLRQLNGRSKKCLYSAVESGEQTLRDTIFIHEVVDEGWDVSLSNPILKNVSAREVYYEKPETAFFHPNAYAMKKALGWMLNRLSNIISECKHPCDMLEMYCGLGAHTMALGKTNLIREIMAVELDSRLVQACRRNIRNNGLEEKVKVSQADAGTWAERYQKKEAKVFDILLVDPPRSGLDEQVCSMALGGSFRHFLYISCGHKALLRDLERLSPMYEVVSCDQLDLFPRTDSIETLVHLQRRN